MFPIFQSYQNICYLKDICSYLTGVNPAQLQRHPANMNMIENTQPYNFAKSKFPSTEKLTNGALVTPTPALHTLWLRLQWRHSISNRLQRIQPIDQVNNKENIEDLNY